MRHRRVNKKEEMLKIIDECQVCSVAMTADNMPYVIPMNFAMEGEFIYLHSDPEGKKAKILERNNNVCISWSTGYEITYVHEEVACSWGMKYKSVIAYGEVEITDDAEEKVRILNLVMKKYAHGRDDFRYNAPALRNVRIYRVRISKMEGRVLGY
ncbi:MAG: pyridoxamine 5'-phosphate oxidase family protein [Bacteroidales bacterium]|nr:pyridoxamine 5'-phosphate oxidase family protein [Bacteroidales bacterium]